MDEKRFTFNEYEDVNYCVTEFFKDGKRMSVEEVVDCLNEQQATIERLERKLEYESRMHKKWKDDCLAILEEENLEKIVDELNKQNQEIECVYD